VDNSTPATRRALAIAECCKPCLAGEDPSIQGAALAELLALFLAGHAPELREVILEAHIEVVRALVPINSKIIRGE
jgi:hypothetical protein